MGSSNNNSFDMLDNFFGALESAKLDEYFVPDKSIGAHFINDHTDFINHEFISEANKVLKLPDGAVHALLRIAETIKASEELEKFTKYCHLRVYHSEEYDQLKVISPERLKELLGSQANKLPVLVLISGIQGTLDYYRAAGIDNIVLEDTLGALAGFMSHYKNTYGSWGLEQFEWLTHFFYGRIFRIGRLLFFPKFFEGDIMVFRNIKSGRACAISEPGIVYRSDGQVNGTNNIYDRENSYEAVYGEDDSYIWGNPVLPSGAAANTVVKLSKLEWHRVLSKGDIILDIHIPGGTKLVNEECRVAFVEADAFYRKYFPCRDYKAFVCTSWLLDPQMQVILPRESNIYRFQREFYLYPILSDDMQMFDNLFGVSHNDINRVSVSTSLQRAVVQHMNKGNRMCMGGMFMLQYDLKSWGSEFYQRDFGWMLDHDLCRH